jgi:hypothetical protein
MTNVINNVTTNYGIPLPNVNNRIVDDVPRLISAIAVIDSILSLKMDSNATGGSIATLNNSGQLNVAQIPAFFGDITSAAGSPTLSLVANGVVPGTYTSVTVDPTGRVVNGSSEAITLKTINGNSLIGSGNIVVAATDSGSGLLDGGGPLSNYGGLPVIDGGHV